MEDPCTCPHCSAKFYATDVSADINELVEQGVTDFGVTAKFDCPKCNRPIVASASVDVIVELTVSTRKGLPPVDERYIEWAKANGRNVDQILQAQK